MTKISDLKPGMNNVAITAKVAGLSDPKQIQTKFGTQTTLTEATLDDGSGTVKLTLWGQQSDGVEEGSTVEITGGFTKEFRDQLQLGVGKGGKIKIQ